MGKIDDTTLLGLKLMRWLVVEQTDHLLKRRLFYTRICDLIALQLFISERLLFFYLIFDPWSISAKMVSEFVIFLPF